MRPHNLPQLSFLARLTFLLLAAPFGLAAQQPALKSHEVNPDRSVTLRLYAPTAASVTVGVDYDRAVSMAKGADGVWTYTTPPLVPALHMYGFTSDGTAILDPLNPAVDPCLRLLTNEVTVPGPAQIWDLADVPHGVVHRHIYRTAVIQGLKGDAETYYVYTPPGYDSGSGRTYPVLYLLHGWTHVAESWMHCGQANLILDNLEAQGRAVPMIVVMPLNYGDMDFVLGADQWDDPSKVAHNLGVFSTALLTEIIPQVETLYRVSPKRGDRAIAGLSMGGGQTLNIAMSHLDRFAYIGVFSSGVFSFGRGAGAGPAPPPEWEQQHPMLDDAALKPGLKLLWFATGSEDRLIPISKATVEMLKKHGFAPEFHESPGGHTWINWRNYLNEFAPQLFR